MRECSFSDGITSSSRGYRDNAGHFAIRGIEANPGPRNADSFRADLHPDLKADLLPVRKDLANPPFNMSNWGGEILRQDVRWKFGIQFSTIHELN